MIKVFSSGIKRIPNLEQFLRPERDRYGELEGCGPNKSSASASEQRCEVPLQTGDAVIGWGHKPTADKARTYAKEKKLPYIALEDGFYRSLRLGVEGARPISITVDPIGVYYDASAPSQLEVWLNDWQSWYTPEVAKEAREAMSIVIGADLSKYNAAPTFSEKAKKAFRERYGVKENRRMILVVDQTAQDSSVTLGGASEASFKCMLDAALQEENAEVFVRTHPDVLAGKKKGYLTDVPDGVHLIADNWAPLSFMGAFDAVYVVTSQMGFEALLLEKPVHVFGVPFYAGWGLTKDHADTVIDEASRLAFHRRVSKPPVHALFAACVLKLSRYVNLISGKPFSPVEALDLLAAQRVANESNRGRFIAIGFPQWKKPYVKAYISGTDCRLDFVRNTNKGLKLAAETGSAAVMWADICTDDVVEKAKQLGVGLLRVEDGFLRSVGLGSDFNHPYSLAVDPDGIYFDPKRPSHLEAILRTIRRRKDLPRLLKRAEVIRDTIISHHLTKYNVNGSKENLSFLEKIPLDKKVILVTGQVDDDASVLRGGGTIRSNRELLEKARQENPEAFIVYKPHPDVESGNRIGKIPEKVLQRNCDLVASGCSLEDLWLYINELHTMTSLSGFEALLRGKKVTTYGRPFYAGWGLTTDKTAERKTNTPLIIDELVAGSLILYPRYWDWQTSQFCRPEDVCSRLMNKEQMDVSLWIKFCRTGRNFLNIWLRK